MARFLHIADAWYSDHIRRNGIRPTSLRNGIRAVFCVPVVPDHAMTLQWARELRAGGTRSFVAVIFDAPDAGQVQVGRYGTEHAQMPATEAHHDFLAATHPAGQEVLAPRGIAAVELRKIAPHPGWWAADCCPETKGRAFSPLRGTMNVARRRAAIDRRMG